VDMNYLIHKLPDGSEPVMGKNGQVDRVATHITLRRPLRIVNRVIADGTWVDDEIG